ncbi:MAG: conjugal transfer protein TraO [Betaproteobacteria bacterium]|nr:conjugal transfer protein TraO [Betaproteobacteria bacterium]
MSQGTAPGKQRILVMNGQRLVQIDKDGKWVTHKVGKAGSLKPGIYAAYTAKDADKALQHTGVVYHADENYVYQQEPHGSTRHPLAAFDAIPETGRTVCITYEEGRALTTDAALTHAHKLKR